MSKLLWTIPNRLRADALHRSVLDWDTLTTAADEIERLRRIIDSRPSPITRGDIEGPHPADV